MTFQDDRNGERRRKSDDEVDNEIARTGANGSGASIVSNSPGARRKRPPAPEFGNALRSAYQRTLAEDIPPEMLDLLGKLG